MRVSPINGYNYYHKIRNIKNSSVPLQEPPVPNQPQFKGQAGRILGALVGGAAAVGLAFAAAPVLICAGPLLGGLGAIAGDETEKKVVEEYKKSNKNKK